jgi:hypothetical protein
MADNVGSDFYCKIFDIVNSTPPMVEPRTSFAIKVVQYLFHLEIPFFRGVVNVAASELRSTLRSAFRR